MFELLFKGGRIVDGTGNPWYRGDVAIADGNIVMIGPDLETHAGRVISVENDIVCPGFIDMHSHSDIAALQQPLLEPKVRQGITTELVGQDGFSLAPHCGCNRNMLLQQVAWFGGLEEKLPEWSSYGEYLDALEKSKPSLNILGLVGHGTVRMAVMGMENRRASHQELASMEGLVRQSMEEGCVGMSSGLVYPPCSFADKEELLRLCRVVAQYGGILVVHMRNESNFLLDSIDELISIADDCGVRLHLSHFKVIGERNWGKSSESLARIDNARELGVDVTFDQYPYSAGMTTLMSLLPPSIQDADTREILNRISDPLLRQQIKNELATGTQWENQAMLVGWEHIVLCEAESRSGRSYVGKSFAEIGSAMNLDPADAMMDMLVHEQAGGMAIVYYGSENDVERILIHPAQMIGSDGLIGEHPHPRTYGCYPRVLSRYVREKQLLPVEHAIRKMTSFPAQRVGLRDRGLLREGYKADLVVFDPTRIQDRATYEMPKQYPDGIDFVVVNGVVTVEKGNHLEERAGEVIRKHA